MADRVLASKFGYHAAELLANNKGCRVVGIVDNNIIDYDIVEGLKIKRSIDMKMYEIAKVLGNR